MQELACTVPEQLPMPTHLHTTTPFLARPPRDQRWLAEVRRRFHQRMRNPALRTLAILDIELRPHTDAFWAPHTTRVAVVTLVPGLCGRATLARLPAAARAEFVATLAELCAVERIELITPPPGWAILSDSLVVLGELGAAIGVLQLLPVSPLLLCGVAAAGAASARAGYLVAPPEEGAW
ncbi:MAG: hypothetical protein ACTHMJ_10185 [Thermomicrobiales bacterium]|jgi:hypothetical protein